MYFTVGGRRVVRWRLSFGRTVTSWVSSVEANEWTLVLSTCVCMDDMHATSFLHNMYVYLSLPLSLPLSLSLPPSPSLSLFPPPSQLIPPCFLPKRWPRSQWRRSPLFSRCYWQPMTRNQQILSLSTANSTERYVDSQHNYVYFNQSVCSFCENNINFASKWISVVVSDWLCHSCVFKAATSILITAT